MGKTFEGIDERLAAWIGRQRLFFVGTAPTAGGHVNVSPKGPIASLALLGPREVAYLDVVGSGAETIAHLRDNGRICLMLCAFEGPPRIVRLHGTGEAIQAGDDRFAPLAARAGLDGDALGGPGMQRAIIRVDLQRISDSCGFGVPRMAYEGERPQMPAWAERKRADGGVEALRDYQREHNAQSIDGLPAVQHPAT
jgi:Pyridoxamine 5'-phosphate oxidase